MTALSTASTVVDDVIRLLADRVGSDVLDRVVVQLLGCDSEPPDAELEALLHTGAVSASLRRDFGAGAVLIAFRVRHADALISRVRLAADAYRVPVRAGRFGTTIWALLPAAARRWVDDVLVAQDLPDHLALIRELHDLRLLPSVRGSLDEMLDLGRRRGWTGFADVERLDAGRRVEALLDLASGHAELVDGPLAGLLDDPSHTSLAETLLAWFALDRDVTAVAERLHLHVNTVRYRLRRAQELSGTDLSDWNQRFLAEVQLRLWDASRAVRPADWPGVP